MIQKKKGVALVFALVLLGILVIITDSILIFAEREFSTTSRNYKIQKSLALAEAGIDRAVNRLKSDLNYTGETTDLGDGSFTTTVTNIETGKKRIESTGCYPSPSNCQARKRIRATISNVSSLTEVSFNYAVHIGDLGLTMYSNAVVNGNAYSNGNITGWSNSRINGDAYAVGTISSPAPLVTGTTYPGSPSQPLPQIDLNYWRTQANISNNPINGNYELNDCTNPMATLGPRKIIGNFQMNSNSCLKLTGPLHVTGTLEMNSNSRIYIDEQFGSYGTVIVVDGTIRMNSNSYIYSTSATPKGYILLATPDASSSSIEINSNASLGIFYALQGTIQINSNGRAIEVNSRQLILNSNAVLDYDQGLAQATFTTGPGGTWSIIRGSWTEVKNSY